MHDMDWAGRGHRPHPVTSVHTGGPAPARSAPHPKAPRPRKQRKPRAPKLPHPPPPAHAPQPWWPSTPLPPGPGYVREDFILRFADAMRGFQQPAAFAPWFPGAPGPVMPSMPYAMPGLPFFPPSPAAPPFAPAPSQPGPASAVPVWVPPADLEQVLAELSRRVPLSGDAVQQYVAQMDKAEMNPDRVPDSFLAAIGTTRDALHSARDNRTRRVREKVGAGRLLVELPWTLERIGVCAQAAVMREAALKRATPSQTA